MARRRSPQRRLLDNVFGGRRSPVLSAPLLHQAEAVPADRNQVLAAVRIALNAHQFTETVNLPALTISRAEARWIEAVLARERRK